MTRPPNCPECDTPWTGDAIIGLSDWDGLYGWHCINCGFQDIFNKRRAERAVKDFGHA